MSADRCIPRLEEAQRLVNAGRAREAEAVCRDVLAEAPGMPEATALLGCIVARMRRLQEAEALLRSAIAARPGVPHWHFELRNVLRYDFRLDESLAEAREAVRLDPDSAQFRNGLSQIHFDRGEYDQGYAAVLDALACDPEHAEAHLSLAHALLASGNFRAGWAEYEWRFRSKLYQSALPKPIRPHWNGMPLPGRRLVVSADQGFGDSFQFARYIPMAAARCAGLTLVCRAPQVPLLSRVPGVQHCVTDLRQAGEHAAFCWLASLPYVLGTELATIPTPIPYLAATPQRRAFWRAELDRRIGSEAVRVGLVWAGNPDNTADWRRSLKLAALQELAAVPGVRLVPLQTPIPESDRPAFQSMGLPDLSPLLTDFGETAAAIANLDLVISVDSAVAHLAGAMGAPAWTLIYEPADWRWLTRREDTPWYPTMRLFRQPRAGAWAEPIARLVQALRQYVGAARPGG
ncbi:MAG TPA: tetratricopeptide repeat protein [Rhodopila sp.]|nr:tetratricopeptide repeat protein [Rhodopila sp.]